MEVSSIYLSPEGSSCATAVSPCSSITLLCDRRNKICEHEIKGWSSYHRPRVYVIHEPYGARCSWEISKRLRAKVYRVQRTPRYTIYDYCCLAGGCPVHNSARITDIVNEEFIACSLSFQLNTSIWFASKNWSRPLPSRYLIMYYSLILPSLTDIWS
jgi:hypothetical protein